MGGDGSLGCFIESMKDNIFITDNLENLIFAPLPFGTGNDLSRSLGWGGSEGTWAKSIETLVN
jgi:diacylglycerol kinase family enzyme